ncbi:ImmA/IrrE family metallo-endopeptidase [Streptomyces sp. NPDC060053]|uniref:ImmA/IrrE family metallo-endopeptidase n=1 Tax=Streptomyces sp. NPDC060053 TaxID=3347047 RepID=UPI003675446F
MALKEKQAAALSGELLIPMAAAIGAALSGRTDEQVAEQFDVSLQFAAWRMNEPFQRGHRSGDDLGARNGQGSRAVG